MPCSGPPRGACTSPSAPGYRPPQTHLDLPIHPPQGLLHDGEMDGWGVKELRAPANPACVCRPDSSLHKKQA